MAGRNFLFVPGPTNIPDRVQRAMVIAMEDHRSSKFPELALAVLAELKKVFKTQTGTTIFVSFVRHRFGGGRVAELPRSRRSGVGRELRTVQPFVDRHV